MHRIRLRPALGLLPLLIAGCDFSPTGPDDPPEIVIPTTCEPGNTVALEVGEAAEFHGSSARFFCVEAGSQSEDYVLVTLQASASPLSLSIRAKNTIAADGPPSPSAGRDLQPSASLLPAHDLPLPDERSHRELREREQRELSGLVGGGGTPGMNRSMAPAAPARVPAVGGLLTLNAQAKNSCDDPLHVTARVEAVSAKAIVVADTANPAGGFTSSDYQHYAVTYDTLIAPLAEANFGAVTDIDGNGRVLLLFTKEVNRLTPEGSDSFTGGFFFSRDLFPRQSTAQLGACAASNQAEILYLMVPDPQGTINQNVRTKEFVDRMTQGTLIHELQHLTNAARRLHVLRLSGAGWSEEIWLNEALSHTAEEILFYRASGLSPEMNIGPSTLQSAGSRAVDAFNRHQVFNLARFHEFLRRPEDNSPYNPTDGIRTRGASWSLLRYVADRRGGDNAQFFHQLVNSSTRGVANLGGALGGTDVFFRWLTDWSVAIYADERVPGLVQQHRIPSWNHPALHTNLHPGRSYPIRTRPLAADTARTQELIGGGSAYFRLGVAGGETGLVEVTSGGALPPSSLRATLLRTR